MSNTPETDAEYRLHKFYGSESVDYPFVDFARTLETQRDEARAEVERLRKRVEELEAHPAFVVDMQTGKFTPMIATSTQPEIFEAHGMEWYRHTPGDAMPCDGEMEVEWLTEDDSKEYTHETREACLLKWGKSVKLHIIGWRPADAPEKLERK